MTKKLTLSIPDNLHKKLADYRNLINISNICSIALRKEIDKVDQCIQEAKKRFEILTTSEAYKLAYEDGMNWAGYHANPVELAIVCNWTNGWLSNDPQAQETMDLLEENNENINKILSGYTTGYEYIFSESFISRGIVSYPIDYDDVDIVEIAVAFSQGAQIIWNRVKNKLIPKLINSND
jgi:hypothetical protein